MIRAGAALLCILCAVTPGLAVASWQSFSSAEGGLADNEVYAIAEGSDGALWFGTPNGVSRFDGFRWSSIGGPPLPNLTVRSLAQDGTGAWWFGTEQAGLARFDGTQWSYWNARSGHLLDDKVTAALVDHAGDVWFCTVRGLARYRPASGEWSTYPPAPDGPLVHSNPWALLEDAAHALWIATPLGVSRLDSARTEWTSYQADPEALGRDSVLALGEDAAGGVWFGTDRGAWRLSPGGSWSHYGRAQGLPSDTVFAFARDPQGGLWVGGWPGIARFDGRTWRPEWVTTPGDSIGRVLSMACDRSGGLWLGRRRLGVLHYDRVTWRSLIAAGAACQPAVPPAAIWPRPGGNCITAMLRDSGGELWFASSDGGVSRLDSTGRWTALRRGPGVPVSDTLRALAADPAGNLWLGSGGAGLAELDPTRTTWRLFDQTSGLAGDSVIALFADRRGDVWAGTEDGVGRWDGSAWSSYLHGGVDGSPAVVQGFVEGGDDTLWILTSVALFSLDPARTTLTRHGPSTGLPADVATAGLRAADGSVWFGTSVGAAHRVGGTWIVYGTLGAPYLRSVRALAEDRAGGIWAGTSMGAARFDGAHWTPYSYAVVGAPIEALAQDASGSMWLASGDGLRRFNGETWQHYTTKDGLANDEVTGILEDTQERLWFASGDGGLTEHDPDRTAPQTVVLAEPATLSPLRNITFSFGAAYGEASDIQFATALDDEPWSLWSAENSWGREGVPDGRHRFRVEARDWAGNVDPTPAEFDFEVDATPPNAILSAPSFGQPVRGVLDIQGRAADTRFRSYRVDARPVGASRWSIPIDSSAAPVVDTLLARWDTRQVGEGDYDLRLAVTDTLGLVGIAQVTVIVDNAPPWAEVTSPARISARSGGDVYTTHEEAHLYFPPRAFAEDAVVSVVSADAPGAVSLPAGASVASPAFDVFWSVPQLDKPATLDLAVNDTSSTGSIAIWMEHGGEGWTRVGGTLDPARGRIAAAITGAGRYVLLHDTGTPGGPGGIGALELTPRVFSPSGTFADRSVAISFTLARAGAASVTVYNRAGRRIQRVVSGQQLGAGANLVRWDGRDEDGRVAEDGIYVVAVEALGETQKRTLAVVR